MSAGVVVGGEDEEENLFIRAAGVVEEASSNERFLMDFQLYKCVLSLTLCHPLGKSSYIRPFSRA